MDVRRKRLIERSRAAKEGRRFHAFYRGVRDADLGRHENPFPAGSEQDRCWQAGQNFAREEGNPPPCRFGPGGSFTSDWPGAEP